MKKTGKKAAVILIICASLFASCGISKSLEMSETSNVMRNTSGVQMANSENKSDYNSDSVMYEAGEDNYYDDYSEESAGGDYINAEGTDANDKNVSDAGTDLIKNDMLVYSCTMNVDVLDFDKAIENFKLGMKQYEAFVEMENFNDGGDTSRWYNEKAQKWNTYTATVRVPSRVYEDFCDAVSELGDLRKKNASVQNVSTEYKDLSTTLEIYEKKEERYLAMLADIKDEQYAISIEDSLTQIQIEIAKLKTRMNKIETDVAYSYVYVTINEVKEYQQQPIKEDTFADRLLNTLKNAGTQFLNFLEELLFGLIYLFPYILLFGAAIFVIVRLAKLFKKSKEKRRAKKNAKSAEDTTETASGKEKEEKDKVK